MVFQDNKPSGQERFLNFSYPWAPNVNFLDVFQTPPLLKLALYVYRSLNYFGNLKQSFCSVLRHFSSDLENFGNAEVWFQRMHSVRVRRTALYIIQTSQFMAHALNLIVVGIVIKCSTVLQIGIWITV